MNNLKEKADLIWKVVDLLRGDYKQSDYGKVILPFTVLRRLDCVLVPTKPKVLDYLPKIEKLKESAKGIVPESYAICKSNMLIKGQNPSNIKFGTTFTVDGLEFEKFDYMLSNLPFGVDWKKSQKIITTEVEKKGMSGRFGAGLPPLSDIKADILALEEKTVEAEKTILKN